MTTVAVCSLKGAPGATTAALALTAALHRSQSDAVVVEADPAGGDLAAMLGLATDPGLVTLAAASRHHSAWPDLQPHVQPLPGGGWVLLAPTDPSQAYAAIRSLADRLVQALDGSVPAAVVDCGRWSPWSPATPLLRQVSTTVVCIEATVQGIEAARVRADELRDATAGRVGLAVVGQQRYSADEIATCTRLPVLGALPEDGRGLRSLLGATHFRPERTALVRSARSLADALNPWDGRRAAARPAVATEPRADGAAANRSNGVHA